MRSFSLFTTDSRYTVPTLTLVEAPDKAAAIARAREALTVSSYHIAVELREGDERIYEEFKPLRTVLESSSVIGAETDAKRST
jgi:hypothetical protein